MVDIDEKKNTHLGRSVAGTSSLSSCHRCRCRCRFGVLFPQSSSPSSRNCHDEFYLLVLDGRERTGHVPGGWVVGAPPPGRFSPSTVDVGAVEVWCSVVILVSGGDLPNRSRGLSRRLWLSAIPGRAKASIGPAPLAGLGPA
jgi:hypothetical protein